MKVNQIKIDENNLIYKRTNYAIFLFNGIFLIFCAVLAVFYAGFNFIYYRTEVGGTSMLPTLISGDAVYINRLSEPQIGDIIVIDRGPNYDPLHRYIIKRFIAKEGDRVEIRKNGWDYSLYLNGQKQTEGYLFNHTLSGDPFNLGNEQTYKNLNDLKQLSPQLFNTAGELVVPAGKVFALGDNRGNSTDSSVEGPYNMEAIQGVLAFIRAKGEGDLQFLINKYTPFKI